MNFGPALKAVAFSCAAVSVILLTPPRGATCMVLIGQYGKQSSNGHKPA
jgi:hypothetical protein